MAKIKLKSKKAQKKPAKRAEKPQEQLSPPAWPEVLAEVFAALARGETTSQICEANPHWTLTASQIHLRIVDSEELYAEYLRARRAAILGISEGVLPIADDGKNDFMEKEASNGNTYTAANHENVQRSKLRIDVRMRLLESLDPNTFGKRVDLSNKDGSLSSAWATALGVANSNKEQEKVVKH
jgi:hypothetical protein